MTHSDPSPATRPQGADLTPRQPTLWLGLAAAVVVCAAAWHWLIAPSFASSREMEARRAQVQALTPAEKERLLDNLKAYHALPDQQRAALDDLEKALDRDPQAADLQQTMDRYCEWLDELRTDQRLNLDDLPTEQRLAEVRKIHQQQVSPADAQKIVQWARQFANTFAERSPGGRGGNAGALAPFFFFERLQRTNLPNISAKVDEALANLRSQVSPELQKRLKTMSREGQLDLLASAARQQMARQFGGRGGRRQAASDEELAQYFDTLRDDEINDLLDAPADEMLRRVRQMYAASRGEITAPGDRDFPRGGERGPWPPGARRGPPPGELDDGPPEGPPGAPPDAARPEGLRPPPGPGDFGPGEFGPGPRELRGGEGGRQGPPAGRATPLGANPGRQRQTDGRPRDGGAPQRGGQPPTPPADDAAPNSSASPP